MNIQTTEQIACMGFDVFRILQGMEPKTYTAEQICTALATARQPEDGPAAEKAGGLSSMDAAYIALQELALCDGSPDNVADAATLAARVRSMASAALQAPSMAAIKLASKWTMEELADFLQNHSKIDEYRLGIAARVVHMAIHKNPPDDALMFQIERLQSMLPEQHRNHVQAAIEWHKSGRVPVEVRKLVPSAGNDKPTASSAVDLPEDGKGLISACGEDETAKPFAFFVQPSGFGPFIECSADQVGCFPAYRDASQQTAAQGGVPEPVVALAKRTLWLAFVWNDHNFEAAHKEAKIECAKWGIKTMEDAEKFYLGLAASPSPAGDTQQQGARK